MTAVRSLRASEEDWARWVVAARRQELSLNAWAKLALNRVAELEAAVARAQDMQSLRPGSSLSSSS